LLSFINNDDASIESPTTAFFAADPQQSTSRQNYIAPPQRTPVQAMPQQFYTGPVVQIPPNSMQPMQIKASPGSDYHSHSSYSNGMQQTPNFNGRVGHLSFLYSWLPKSNLLTSPLPDLIPRNLPSHKRPDLPRRPATARELPL
jgi:hypothetical protein